MKPVEGITLGKVIKDLKKRDKIDYQELSSIFLKICDAISYAHSRDVIHLDLKPENIQVGKFGEVLVVDWGLAQVLNSENKQITEENLFLLNDLNKGDFIQGTPGYMAPEQINSELGTKDKSSDIYALGAILYTLLCSQAPHNEDSIKETLKATVKGTITQPSLIRASAPKGLEAISLKALSLKKSERYDSVLSLIDDVKKWQGGYIPSAENKNFFKAILSLLKRHKQVTFFLCLTFILTIFFVLRIIKEKDYAQQQAKIATEQEQIANKQKDLVFKQKGIVESQKKSIEEAFSLYKGEQQQRLTISQKASPHLQQQALAKLKTFDYKNALQNGQLAVLWDPNDSMALLTYSNLLLYTQNFSKAIEYANQINDFTIKARKFNIIRIASEYENMIDDRGLLPIEYFLQLISQHKKEMIMLGKKIKADRMIIHFINYAYTQDYTLSEKKMIAERAVQMTSFYKDDWRLKASIEGDKFNVDLSNHKSLKRIDVLALFPMRSINLSDSGVKDLSPLYASNLEHADFRNCPIETSQMKFFENLKSVVLTQDQLPNLKNRKIQIIRK